VRLANDDTMSGTIGRIAGGKISVKMSFADKPIDIPLTRIGLVKFGRKDGAAPEPLPEIIPIGKVIEVNKEKQTLGFEEILRGAAELDEELEIHRAGKLIGQVKVLKGEDDAILPAEILAEAEAIKPGDLVVRPASLEGKKTLPESTAALTQRGRLTLRLHEWRDGQAIIMHPHIGLIRLSPAALSSLQFK